MFKLLRRISGSFTNRLDRVWDDDATSNAPQIGRKRRMSDEDDDDEGSKSGSVWKRPRGHSDAEVIPEETEPKTPPPEGEGSRAASGTPTLAPTPTKETEEVRQVTKGVKEVDLEDGSEAKEEAPEVAPEEAAEAEVPSSETSKPEAGDEPTSATKDAVSPSDLLDDAPAADDSVPDKSGGASESGPEVEQATSDVDSDSDSNEEPSEKGSVAEEPAPTSELVSSLPDDAPASVDTQE
ncbi:hypothetical protein M0805_009458 [Coniferiporia weirii]|nr:hypothetical protein M0805_009458 [Coniferiporia weirii]